jgi:4-carboxymuconolactone decarboxylase
MARLPYVTRDLLPEDQKSYWDELSPEGRGRLPLVTQILMYRPPLAVMAEHINRAVRFDLSLPRSSVELVILTCARELNCLREWAVHLNQARTAGVREEAIESIKHHKTPENLTEEEAELVKYAQELLNTRRVSDATFAAAQKRLGDVGVVDLTALVGTYSMLGAVMNAFEVEPPDDEAVRLPMP